MGISGERGSGMSVLPPRHDDDDYYYYSYYSNYYYILIIKELFIRVLADNFPQKSD